jgi:hypothetical protein
MAANDRGDARQRRNVMSNERLRMPSENQRKVTGSVPWWSRQDPAFEILAGGVASA